MKHHCHALGCKSSCPPRHLMCGACWSRVPHALQAEVYRTARLRNANAIDKSWAPWWRAQAKAIHHVAMLVEPNEARGAKYLERELAFADTLESGRAELVP